ncbi:uncharacterized protein G2W53_004692 [Senna tora]|uniref:Uncharacterized protein n=1 Tax=Senna tora TaxID=362788 RepID=A0A834XCA9_9FABA|nr:uncharacterized protein G2W53_004692 [Senna tora]
MESCNVSPIRRPTVNWGCKISQLFCDLHRSVSRLVK